MLSEFVILLTYDHSLPLSERPLTVLEKYIWPEDADESSNSSSVILIWWGVFVETYDTAPFSDPADGFYRGS